MATVTTTLNEVNLGHLTGRAPELIFTLSDPATSSLGLIVTAPVTAVPSASGFVTVNLVDTATMAEKRYYTLRVRWLDAAGNFHTADYPDWKIRVPIEGGALHDLVNSYGDNPLMVFTSPTEPDPWPVGTFWIDSSVDTPTSGDYYVMEP